MVGQAEIHRMANSSRSEDRKEAVELLRKAFSHIPDKVEAWRDLIRLAENVDSGVRWQAASSLGFAFSHVPDKVKAWHDLHKLTHEGNSYVRMEAAYSLGFAFSHVPDKAEAWQDLHKLTQDEDSGVRMRAASSLSSAFSHIPDKVEAWRDLHKLTQDEDSYVRREAAYSLITAFFTLPNKIEVWHDLISLIDDVDPDVRMEAAHTLGTAFSQLPYKVEAWHELIRLTEDGDSYVRRGAAYSLGSVFLHVLDKVETWRDIIRLTEDGDSNVRMYAYHSLGKALVYRATESADISVLRINLENAVEYFEKSVRESEDSPARFCYPFYRSYFAITFRGESQDIVQKYLAEAKEAVGGSESRDELLKAVENLAGALMEIQGLKNRPLQDVLRDLRAYEWYCTQAETHMDSAEDKAPGAVKLLRRGNPWIKENIEAAIREIQDYAWQICQQIHDKGPEAKVFCRQIKEAAGSFSGEDLTETLQTVSDFISILKEKCQMLPEGDRELIRTQLDGVDCTGAIPEKLIVIKIVVKFFLSRIQKDDEFIRRLEEMKEKMDNVHADLVSFRESILGQFNSSERAILSAIFERLDKDNLEIVGLILDAVKSGSIPRDLTIETVNVTKDLISEIRAMRLEIQDPDAAEGLNSWEEAFNSPELGIENMIKVTIPLIPFLLTYEGSYKFQTGMKLDSAWNKLRTLVRR